MLETGSFKHLFHSTPAQHQLYKEYILFGYSPNPNPSLINQAWLINRVMRILCFKYENLSRYQRYYMVYLASRGQNTHSGDQVALQSERLPRGASLKESLWVFNMYRKIWPRTSWGLPSNPMDTKYPWWIHMHKTPMIDSFFFFLHTLQFPVLSFSLILNAALSSIHNENDVRNLESWLHSFFHACMMLA